MAPTAMVLASATVLATATEPDLLVLLAPSMATPPPPTLLATATLAMASVPLMPRLRLMAPTDTLVLLDSATAMVVPTPLA